MLLQLAVLLTTATAAPCDMGLSVTAPGPGESYVLARATGRAVVVPSSFEALRADPAAREAVAHEHVVIDATRADPRDFDSYGVLAPTQTCLAVPWAYDAACDLVRWTEDHWVPAGAQVVFRLSSARVHEGQRVVDVLGWHWPYPYARFLERELGPGAPPDRADWLSAADFFALMHSAPRAGSEESRSEQLQRFENHYRSGPTYLLTRFPGPQLLERVRRWASPGEVP